MPQQVFGADATVSIVNRALANTSPSHSVYVNQVATAGTTAASQLAYAQAVGAQYAVGKTAADLSALLLGNMGVSNAILQTALTDYIAANGPKNIGIIALQLGQILAGLEGDGTFGAAAKAWNQEVTNAYQYSSSANNNTPQQGDDGANTTALTRFTDALTGHQFSGYLDYNQFTGNDEQTLTTSDRLTGTAAADDILFAQQVGGSRPTLNGIEIVSIDAKANNTALDLSDANGVKTIINAGSAEAAALAFNNLKNLVDVVVRNTNSNTTVSFNATVIAGAADALSLTVDGAGVRADPANFTVNGIETLNVTASGAASVLGTVATGNTLSKLTIAGDQNLTVGTKTVGGFDSNAIATVDASTATGNLFLNLAASAARDQTVTTGTGNDVVVTGALSATDTFNLGAGNDRLVLTVVSTNEAAKLNGVEEVETRVANTNLNLTNAADVKLLAVAENAGFANVTAVKSGTTVGFEGAGAVNAVSNSALNFTAVTYNLANATGTADVIDFTFKNAGVALGANSTVAIGALTNTGNNTETLNFKFNDVVASNTVTVADIAGNLTALKTLTVASDSKVVFNGVADLLALTSVDTTGVKAGFTATFGALAQAGAATVKLGGAGVNDVTVTSDANLGATAATTATLLTVDASAGTGAQKITVTNNDLSVAAVADTNTGAKVLALLAAGNKVGANVVGGAGADQITVNTAANAISLVKGGAGADTIVLDAVATSGADIVVLSLGDAGASVATGDTITNFNAGAGAGSLDYIDLRGFGFDGALWNVNAKGATALNGSANEFAANAAVATYVLGTNLVVAIDANGDRKLGDGDLVLTLVGVNSADFDAADILFG